MSVVSNSSPLIALARIQRLDLVPAVLKSALIPPAVAREIAPSIPVLPDWLEMRAPTRGLSVVASRGRLGDGEWEAIALAVELGASAIVIDGSSGKTIGRGGRPQCDWHSWPAAGSQAGGPRQTIRAEVDKLLETSFFLAQELYDQLLRLADEQGS